MHAPLEVLVVEPHRAMRTSLCNVLAAEEDLHVAAQRADMLSVLRDASRTHADVAIVDARVAMLGPGSPAGTIGALAKRVPVVVIGMGGPAVYTQPYLDAGAFGYWCKTAEVDELIGLLRQAAGARRHAA